MNSGLDNEVPFGNWPEWMGYDDTTVRDNYECIDPEQGERQAKERHLICLLQEAKELHKMARRNLAHGDRFSAEWCEEDRKKKVRAAKDILKELSEHD